MEVQPTPSVETVTLTGTLAAQVESNLAFRTSGRVIERLVDVGDRVEPGQLLARIDAELQRAAVESANAVLASAEAQVTQAAAAFARSESLLKRGFTTRREFDAAERALKVARANAASATARLASAEEDLTFTDLTADAAGVVTARQLDVGEVAQAAATVFTVALDGPRDAVFDLYESLLIEERRPPEIVVALAADPSVNTTGEIRQVSPTVDPVSGTVRVKVGLEGTPPSMSLGAAVTGTALLPSTPVYNLPSSAITSVNGRPAVWVFDTKSETAVTREIHPFAYSASSVSVGEGLEAGDLVITDGTKLLRPGQKISASDVQGASE
ncbi:efflux RND transporter periplasmic adaptor subunit [Tianweitania sediminis]|uniref:efflux RND transporter periplasmic adaptor subunit n=1 Tax=Tianweitania sediminis TaxID=1502156 RepID=UPI003158D1ED